MSTLDNLLQAHSAWLRAGGKGAPLSFANANLLGANLRGADLYSADLRGVNLCGADLRGADLRGANLCDANLCGANLRGADLYGADLFGANLRSVYLCDANLCSANLRGANLYSADLRGANLRGADLCGADLCDALLPGFQLLEGDLIVWKSAEGTPGTGPGRILIKLLVPAAARRTATLVGRKCRAEYAQVLAILRDGQPLDEARSWHTRTFIYRVGEIVRPDKYDDDFRVECSHGIHFYQTREEAERA